MEENESTELNIDTLHILRSVIKVSSAFNNLDDISCSKYYKYKFKKEAERWNKYMELHTKSAMEALMEENEALLIDVYANFEGCSKNIFIADADKTSLIVFYAKITSAMNDIEKMNDQTNLYSIFMKYLSVRVLNEIKKQYKCILEIKDEEGKGVDYLVSYYNDFAEKIMNYNQTTTTNELGTLDEGQDKE